MSPPPSALDRVIGALFWLAWRALGLAALPLLTLHPRTRAHVWAVPAPPPGRTWLHGASAGEHQAARGLATALPAPPWRTSTSLRTPVHGAFPAPYDLPWVAARWLDRARPGRLVLVEAELWPGWLAACRARRIPVAVVNARPGRGTSRWREFGPLWRWLTEGITFIDQETVGDLKLSAPAPPAGPRIAGPLVVGASTRLGDEARLLDAWQQLPSPRPRLILAPRHAHRFDEVAALLDARGVAWVRRTAGTDDSAAIMLLDTMGELAGAIATANAAFIGGTFDETLGGHSPAEAIAAGVPVLRGPHTWANPAAWSRATDFSASMATGSAASNPALYDALCAALAHGRVATPAAPPPEETVAAQVVRRLPTPAAPPETPARPWLAPLIPVVEAIARRRPAWRDPAIQVGIPVVSVGGLTAGGSGKTPVAAWLAAHIPGAWVVGRGYRRPVAGDDARVGLPSAVPARPLGDELEFLRRRGVPVVSAPDRVQGAQIAARQGARVVFIDDGFQHRRLHRDLDIVCIDARWPTGRGRIPVGTGREGWSAMSRADVVWVHNAPSLPTLFPIPGPGHDLPQVRSRLVAKSWISPSGEAPLDAVRGPAPVLVGIARPEGFLGTLNDLGVAVSWVKTLPDHAPLLSPPAGALITEKDAARLSPDADVRTLRCGLDVHGAKPLLARIEALLQDGRP